MQVNHSGRHAHFVFMSMGNAEIAGVEIAIPECTAENRGNGYCTSWGVARNLLRGEGQSRGSGAEPGGGRAAKPTKAGNKCG